MNEHADEIVMVVSRYDWHRDILNHMVTTPAKGWRYIQLATGGAPDLSHDDSAEISIPGERKTHFIAYDLMTRRCANFMYKDAHERHQRTYDSDFELCELCGVRENIINDPDEPRRCVSCECDNWDARMYRALREAKEALK